jgi:hypothetical protein
MVCDDSALYRFCQFLNSAASEEGHQHLDFWILAFHVRPIYGSRRSIHYKNENSGGNENFKSCIPVEIEVASDSSFHWMNPWMPQQSFEAKFEKNGT